MNKLFEFLDKYKEILSISQERILFKHDPTIFYQTDLTWDRTNHTWIISYKETLLEYYIVHELGHIHLARRKFSFDGFAVQAPDYLAEEFDFRLKPLFNQLLDGFVDYSIAQFNEIYKIIQKKYNSFLEEKDDFEEMVNDSEEFLELLSWYFLFYISFNFILRREVQLKFKKQIDQRLKYIKTSVLAFKSMINLKIFKELDEKLKKFDSIKNETDPKQTILYIVNLIYTFDFWEKKELIKQAKIWFQF